MRNEKIKNFKELYQRLKIEANLKDTYIKELEKENAELEEKWLQATDEGTSWAHLKSLENENAKLKEQNRKLLESCAGATMMYEHLTKAKELLKWFVKYFREVNLNLETCKDKIAEAEQF